MYLGKSKQLPFLSQYLQHRAQTLPSTRGGSWTIVLVLPVLFGFFFLGGNSNLFFTDPFLFATLFQLLWMAVVGLIIVFVVTSMLGQRSSKVLGREEEIKHILHRFLFSLNRRRLHLDLDPTGAQLLESCAYYWQRVRTLFDGPYWSSNELSEHYRMIRAGALEASEQAMEDAVLTGDICLGTREFDPGYDFSSAYGGQSSFNLDTFGQHLGRIGTADTYGFVHHSPHARGAYEPLYAIATKLRDLSVEVEKFGTEMLRVEGIDQPSSVVGSPLDRVIGELKAATKAENELSEDTHLEQGAE